MTRPPIVTPCHRQSALFDSTEPGHHAQAKALCDACPFAGPCAEALRDTIATWGYDRSHGPRGTWAGRLLDPTGNTRGQNPCGTPAAYNRHRYHGEPPCEPCKAAHTARARDAKRRARERAKEVAA